MSALTKHQSECLEKIKKEFGNREFTTDDINPIMFQRPDFVLRTLREKGFLKWRVEVIDKDYFNPKVYFRFVE